MTTFDNNTKSRNLKVWEGKLRVALTGMLPFNEEYGAQRRYMVGEGVRQWFDKQNHAVLDKIARLLLENSHGLEMFTDFALEEEKRQEEERQEEEEAELTMVAQLEAENAELRRKLVNFGRIVEEEEAERTRAEQLQAVHRDLTELRSDFQRKQHVLNMKKERLRKSLRTKA